MGGGEEAEILIGIIYKVVCVCVKKNKFTYWRYVHRIPVSKRKEREGGKERKIFFERKGKREEKKEKKNWYNLNV